MSSLPAPPKRAEGAGLDTTPRSRRSPVAVTPHVLASKTAVDVMETGGNAVDAMVAANAVLAVVLPDTCGPGGDLFALIHEPTDERPAALNASGRAGTFADAATLRDEGHREFPVRHPLSITVPGCVDGWEAMVGRFGSRSIADLLAPAIALARDGFPVSEELAASLARIRELIGSEASAAALYPEGRSPEPGAMIRRPDLATTLEDVAAGGRRAFYEGRVGDEIRRVTDGAITQEDLARHQVEWVEPLGIACLGQQAWTIPPNSQGYLALGAIRLFELLDPPHDPDDPAYTHAAIEAYRALAWDRNDVCFDPGDGPGDPAALLDPQLLAGRVGRIRPDRPAQWPPPPWQPGGTAYLCARDGEGLGVSLIQSNYYGIGSGRSAGDTGVFLHNRGAGFNLEPGHPNELRSGRRPLHTLAPTLWTRDGALSLLLGTRGGQYQPQLVAQVAAHHLWAGLKPRAAQARPRWEVDGWDRGTPDHRISLERGFASRVLDGLRLRGHDADEVEPWQPGWGPVSMITLDGGLVEGTADPRVSTSSALAGAPVA